MACANFAFLVSALERFNMLIDMISAESEHKRVEKASGISDPQMSLIRINHQVR